MEHVERLSCGSATYKKLIETFIEERDHQSFTYTTFVHWLMKNHLRISSLTGRREYEQAIFESILAHEHQVVKSYNQLNDHLETIFSLP